MWFPKDFNYIVPDKEENARIRTEDSKKLVLNTVSSQPTWGCVCFFFFFSWKSFLSFLYLPSSKYLKHLARYVGDLFRLFSLDYDVWKTKVHLSLFLEKGGGVDTLSYVHTFSVFNSLPPGHILAKKTNKMFWKAIL